jgi:hypothetical protein
MDYAFSLPLAQAAHARGELGDWIQSYLRSEGHNHHLADYLLAAQPTLVILQEFPLHRLTRIMGPEPGLLFTESTEKWKRRVTELMEIITSTSSPVNSSVQFPPLIVTDLWQDLQLSDGSHRHEALLRCGATSYWTAFLFTKASSLKLLD